MKLLSLSALLVALLMLSGPARAEEKGCQKHKQKDGTKSTCEEQDGFVRLFDGKTLEGWDGDPAFWSVEDGVILGSSEETKVPHNTFLSTKKTYKNFVLKIEFKLRNHNSGVQVRSECREDYVVAGYQADIAENRFMGILYEERGRGILANVKAEDVAPHVKTDDWNEYEIICDGPKIIQKLNGFTTVDYTEKDSEKGATEGVIALQMHQGPPMQIRFREIRIKELP